jgi:hypothetical protein
MTGRIGSDDRPDNMLILGIYCSPVAVVVRDILIVPGLGLVYNGRNSHSYLYY